MNDEHKPVYTLDDLTNFINSVGRGKTPDDDLIFCAAMALADAISGNDIRENIGLKPKPGQRKKIFNADRYHIDSDVFKTVHKYLIRNAGYQETIDLIINITGCSENTAKRLIKELKPRVESYVRFIESMKKMARKK